MRKTFWVWQGTLNILFFIKTNLDVNNTVSAQVREPADSLLLICSDLFLAF